jgi:hypothetical protein
MAHWDNGQHSEYTAIKSFGLHLTTGIMGDFRLRGLLLRLHCWLYFEHIVHIL